jgi:2-haloacid dehalogenase
VLNFDSYRVLTFDCYGTLIDWRNGILGALSPLLAEHGVAVEDDQILQTYAEIEAEIQAGPYKSYASVLRELAVKLAERFGFLPGPAEFGVMVDSLPNWLPFDDTVESLNKLKTKYQLGIISNTADDLFAQTNKRLEVEFDYIITAAQAGAYKPDHKVFNLAFDKIGLPREKILHVAQSLFHDHIPAKELGLTTVWINRSKMIPGRVSSAVSPDAEFPDLASLVKAVGL